MKLVDITSEKWEDVIFLTTNESITVKNHEGSYEAKGMPSLCEDHFFMFRSQSSLRSVAMEIITAMKADIVL